MCILCGSSGLEAYLSGRIFVNSLQLCRIDHVNHLTSSSYDIESDRVQLQKNIHRESSIAMFEVFGALHGKPKVCG
jgi:hypothetical protein